MFQSLKRLLDWLREPSVSDALPRPSSGPLADSSPLPTQPHSVDAAPWRHPYLTEPHLKRFRDYSERVWDFALDHFKRHPAKPTVAFMVNMAQNMYKWGCMARRYGAEAELYVNAMDGTAINSPEWEEFDGEFDAIMNAAKFLELYPDIRVEIPCHRVGMDEGTMLSAYHEFLGGQRRRLLHLLADRPGLRHEPLLAYQGFYPYARWAAELGRYDVLYVASTPFAAYASGRPYCVFSVGGDLQYDCGRGDDHGRAMVLAFNAARFLTISNPHAVGHSRRLGLTNGVYLPYPIDSDRYCPGVGMARKDWEARCGRGVYVLTTARLDSHVKGFGQEFLDALQRAASACPALRFVFMDWGKDCGDYRRRVMACSLREHCLFLSPVGKKRLIDYYRSADVVLDQLVYGYYGATALEAASIGKPVVMKLRADHYRPLYEGDVMPALNVGDGSELSQALVRLATSPKLRGQLGQDTRQWLVRHHGAERTIPLLLALLRVTADRIPLPHDLLNPLRDPLSSEEEAYHAGCQVPS